jgi:hypothetical protein
LIRIRIPRLVLGESRPMCLGVLEILEVSFQLQSADSAFFDISIKCIDSTKLCLFSLTWLIITGKKTECRIRRMHGKEKSENRLSERYHNGANEKARYVRDKPRLKI